MSKMTDLEMTKLCAEAMGLKWRKSPFSGKWPYIQCEHYLRDTSDDEGPLKIYDPLHDDAQAMALVKRFNLCFDAPDSGRQLGDPKTWQVFTPNDQEHHYAIHQDLNRAIVECVCQMHKWS